MKNFSKQSKIVLVISIILAVAFAILGIIFTVSPNCTTNSSNKYNESIVNIFYKNTKTSFTQKSMFKFSPSYTNDYEFNVVSEKGGTIYILSSTNTEDILKSTTFSPDAPKTFSYNCVKNEDIYIYIVTKSIIGNSISLQIT